MKVYTVKVPEKVVDVAGSDGRPSGSKISAFILLLCRVLDSAQNRSRAEILILHRIEEKIEPYIGTSPRIPEVLEFEDSELEFVKEAIQSYLKRGEMLGRGWYFLTGPIDDAQVRKVRA